MKLTKRGQWACWWVTVAGTVLLAGLCLPLPPAGMSLPPCPTEDSRPAGGDCSWDASEQGNGKGYDFWVTEDSSRGVCYTYPGHPELNRCHPNS